MFLINVIDCYVRYLYLNYFNAGVKSVVDSGNTKINSQCLAASLKYK